MDPNTQHPSNMSQADLDALKASDPAAFEDDDIANAAGDGDAAGDDKATAAAAKPDKAGAAAGDDAGDGGDDKDKAKPDAAGAEGGDDAAKPDADKGGKDPDAAPDDAAKPDGAAAGAAEGGDGDGAGGPPAMVPRARLDQVVAKSGAKDRVINQQAAELAQLREALAANAPPKDFDAEFNALQKQLDDGDIEEADYVRELRKLTREEASYTASTAAMETRQKLVQQAIETTWQEDLQTWAGQHETFLADEGNVAVFDRALKSVFAFYGNTITNAELLEKAGQQAFEFTGYTPPDDGKPKGPEPPAEPPKESDAAKLRRAQNAARASEASNAPPPLQGGVGARTTDAGEIDLAHLKPGSFSKLPKAEQEKMLGEGAL